MVKLHHIKCLVILILFFGCGKKNTDRTTDIPSSCDASSSAPTSDTVNGLTRLQISATTVASCVTTYTGPHLAFPPATTAKNILAVFLPGTDGTPNDSTLFSQRGAVRGYHSIGLMYVNPDSVNTICNASAPNSLVCAGEVREETLTGSNASSLISVDLNNSIEGRLLALLEYLNTHRPTEGWGQYYSGDQIIWTKVYLSGHSQGSGHAAYQAKRKLLGRVTLYSGTSDYNAIGATLPSWMSDPSTTPAARFGAIRPVISVHSDRLIRSKPTGYFGPFRPVICT